MATPNDPNMTNYELERKEFKLDVPKYFNFGYDVVVYVGRALFLDSLPVARIIEQLARRHVHLSASTVGAFAAQIKRTG